MSDKLKAVVSQDLVDALRETFPDKFPHDVESLEQLWERRGQQQVVLQIETMLRAQVEERSLKKQDELPFPSHPAFDDDDEDATFS